MFNYGVTSIPERVDEIERITERGYLVNACRASSSFLLIRYMLEEFWAGDTSVALIETEG
jgi:hypothetical protein